MVRGRFVGYGQVTAVRVGLLVVAHPRKLPRSVVGAAALSRRRCRAQSSALSCPPLFVVEGPGAEVLDEDEPCSPLSSLVAELSVASSASLASSSIVLDVVGVVVVDDVSPVVLDVVAAVELVVVASDLSSDATVTVVVVGSAPSVVVVAAVVVVVTSAGVCQLPLALSALAATTPPRRAPPAAQAATARRRWRLGRRA